MYTDLCHTHSDIKAAGKKKHTMLDSDDMFPNLRVLSQSGWDEKDLQLLFELVPLVEAVATVQYL